MNNLGRTMPEVARLEVGLIFMAGLIGPMFLGSKSGAFERISVEKTDDS